MRATKHYNLSEYKEALDEFKDAYRAFEEPLLLFNIAQCQRQLGLRTDAIHSYRAYLRESKDIRNRDEVERVIASLEQAARDEEHSRPPQGTLTPEPQQKVVVTPVPEQKVVVTPVLEPVPAPVTPSLVVVAQPARTPVYKKWWLWTTIGVVAVGVGLGLGLGLSGGTTYPAASTPGGRVRF